MTMNNSINHSKLNEYDIASDTGLFFRCGTEMSTQNNFLIHLLNLTN